MNDLDLICFSHLRWNFVFQRPQHLLTRFSKKRRVFYIEEPIYGEEPDHNQVTLVQENLWVVVPHLQHYIDRTAVVRLAILLKELFAQKEIKDYLFWYYTPMYIEVTRAFNPELVVYDCMDELSAFKFAPPELKENEEKLFQQADLVFTGGHSLYEAKKHRHSSIYPFPSSIDKEHFSRARGLVLDPTDQQDVPHPRIGFYGVIDERMNINMIGKVAESRPDWHFVMIGPIVKIDQASLPVFSNIHYLGNKSYQELPTYLAGWDIAMIPFELNDSTRFVSPTKTPEYLAAGKPVISSSIQDVINPYAANKLVRIADTAEEFIVAAESELQIENNQMWLSSVDAFLYDISWDSTWSQMMNLIDQKLEVKKVEKKNNKLNLKKYIYV
jgi:glycosyltransferase involved in cell wall biosynthesis